MPSCARKEIVREGEIGVYHTWSRCVQKAFLCGLDPVTGRDFDYRRDWIKSLLIYQAKVFAVDIGNYSVLSNHQHLIARTRPDISAKWSDEEVAWRWKLAWPTWIDGEWVREPTDQELAELLAKPERIPILRANLASLSWFMARWKEPIARLANAEMDRLGHYYEQRYGSREILDDPANLCVNIYDDLNQMKAGMATSLEDSHCSAIQDRLRAWHKEQALASVESFQASGLEGYSLVASDVELLLADCFLAPIGDQAPCQLANFSGKLILPNSVAYTITSESKEMSSSEPASSELPADSGDPHIDSDVSDITSEASESSSTTEDSSVAERSKSTKRGRRSRIRPVPTRKIHQRLVRGLRHRASDDVFLGIPRPQYLAIVIWTAERWLAQKNHEKEPHELPENIAGILRRWGINPDYWCELIDRFGDWFHHAVGRQQSMDEKMQHTNKRWMHGIRQCRQVFT